MGSELQASGLLPLHPHTPSPSLSLTHNQPHMCPASAKPVLGPRMCSVSAYCVHLKVPAPPFRSWLQVLLLHLLQEALLTTPTRGDQETPLARCLLSLSCSAIAGYWQPAQSQTSPGPLTEGGLSQSQVGVWCGQSSGSPFPCRSLCPPRAHIVGVDESGVFATEILHTVVHHVHQGGLTLVLPIQPWGRGQESLQHDWPPDTPLPADLLTGHGLPVGHGQGGGRRMWMEERSSPDPQQVLGTWQGTAIGQ